MAVTLILAVDCMAGCASNAAIIVGVSYMTSYIIIQPKCRLSRCHMWCVDTETYSQHTNTNTVW